MRKIRTRDKHWHHIEIVVPSPAELQQEHERELAIEALALKEKLAASLYFRQVAAYHASWHRWWYETVLGGEKASDVRVAAWAHKHGVK